LKAYFTRRFFVVPFLGVTVFFIISSIVHETTLRRGSEALARDQLAAAAGMLRATTARFLEEGKNPAEILDFLATVPSIYFTALLDEGKNVLAWNSRFEGYMPVSFATVTPGDSVIIKSPAGRIYTTCLSFSVAGRRKYSLFLGYSLVALDAMLFQSLRNTLITLALILLGGALFFRGLSALQADYVAKAAEAEREKKEKERYREISALTSGVAHEIKNPLNSLSLFFDLLAAKNPSGFEEDIGLGKKEIRKIADIVDRFSQALKPLKLNDQKTAFADILDGAISSLKPEFPALETRVTVSQGKDIRLKGDRELLTTALVNLMRNSLEASADTRINIGLRHQAKSVEIDVRDSGPGIEADKLRQVFEPFYSTKANGMGVGLYLVKKIIESHGGSIEAGLHPGGTVFRIKLPEA